MKGIHVTSEIKPLKKVLLHRPGKELLNLTPDTLGELLFDDIPFLPVAQAEHDAFAKVLRDNGVEVVYIENLLAEVFDLYPEVREQFIHQFIKEGDIHTEKWHNILFKFFNAYTSNYDLVMKFVEGVNLDELDVPAGNTLADFVDNGHKLVLNPMPNLYFQRDPFASVGDGATLNRMYSVTRNRETIFAEYIFNHHPDFKGYVEKWYDRYEEFHIEGGDVLNLTETTLAIGISQRTEADAIDLLASKIFHNPNSKIDTILAFDIPNNRAMMHLDTVFTQIDTDKFTIHPGILGPLTVYKLVKADNEQGYTVEKMETHLEELLAETLGVEKVTLIKCGGEDPIAAEREQWNDGSNTLCIAPGVIVCYERNDVTNALLEQYGLTVLTIPRAELSRGRGGPRCMSMPLERES